MGLFLCQTQSSEIVPRFVADSSTSTGLKWAAPGGGGSMVKVAGATFTSQTTVDVDGCFTSTYLRYLVALQISSSTGNNGDDMQLQFRYAGPTTQTSDYFGSFFLYGRSSGLVQYGYDTTATALLDPIGSIIQMPMYMYFSNVGNSSQNPLISGTGQGGNEQAVKGFTVYNDVARTYTGFRLLKQNAGTITGSYTVYGLEN